MAAAAITAFPKLLPALSQEQIQSLFNVFSITGETHPLSSAAELLELATASIQTISTNNPYLLEPKDSLQEAARGMQHFFACLLPRAEYREAISQFCWTVPPIAPEKCSFIVPTDRMMSQFFWNFVDLHQLSSGASVFDICQIAKTEYFSRENKYLLSHLIIRCYAQSFHPLQETIEELLQMQTLKWALFFEFVRRSDRPELQFVFLCGDSPAAKFAPLMSILNLELESLQHHLLDFCNIKHPNAPQVILAEWLRRTTNARFVELIAAYCQQVTDTEPLMALKTALWEGRQSTTQDLFAPEPGQLNRLKFWNNINNEPCSQLANDIFKIIDDRIKALSVKIEPSLRR